MDLQSALTVGGIVLGALVAFWVVRKVVKLILTIVIVAVLAAVAVVCCVRAGYLSRETAEKINPLNSEQVRQKVREAGAWASEKTTDLAKRAISSAVDGAVRSAVPTNGLSR